jgi:phosphohistidine phosphatase SixA
MFFPLRCGATFRAIKALFIALLLAGSGPILATELANNLATLLQGPQHILLMRHADAPGIGDPSGFSLQDCSTQRNLGKRGRQQSIQIGQWLKAQGVADALVLTSPWCRARDTASGMAVGDVSDETSLASFFETQERRESQNIALRSAVRERLLSKGKQPLIMVSHQVNITKYTGEYLASGAMLLVKVDASGKPISVQRLSAF